MDKLESIVDSRTRIGLGFRKHAAVQAIDAYLDDWQVAYHLLGRRILGLELLREERVEQIDNGKWPPKLDSHEKE